MINVIFCAFLLMSPDTNELELEIYRPMREHGITISPDGSIFVMAKTHILKYDRRGNKLKVIGRSGQGPGEFSPVQGIVFGNKNLYVKEHGRRRISVFDQNGKFQRVISTDHINLRTMPLKIEGGWVFITHKHSNGSFREAYVVFSDEFFEKRKVIATCETNGNITPNTFYFGPANDKPLLSTTSDGREFSFYMPGDNHVTVCSGIDGRIKNSVDIPFARPNPKRVIFVRGRWNVPPFCR